MTTTFDSKEGIEELIRRWAPAAKQKIIENEFIPQITFYSTAHPESPRAIFFPRMVDHTSRGPISWATHVLASSIDNLAGIAFIHDGYNATQMTKTNGERWGPGDMQKAFEEQTEDAHLITESLYYSVLNDSSVFMASLPYDRTEGDITFRWDDLNIVSTDEDKIEAAGFYPDMMRHAFESPKLISSMKEQLGLDHEDLQLQIDDARLHALSASVKMVIVKTQMMCMIPCFDEAEHELIKRSLDSGVFSDQVRGFDQDEMAEIAVLHQAFEAPSFGE